MSKITLSDAWGGNLWETWPQDGWSRELEQSIRTAFREIRFGTVTLVIQDGKVIQIDKNEKIRLE